MDANDYWTIADSDIEIQNPMTDRKLRLLDDYCDMADGLRVLDVGCGKAWVMRGWAERHAIEGVGVDTNRQFLEVARRRPPAKGKLSFVEGPAGDYKVEPGSFDVVMCLGASFALGGFVHAIDWMTRAARPGAAVVIGDLTLKHRPAVPTGEALPHEVAEMVNIVGRHDADVSALISASDADFERYVSHHRHATMRWARQHRDHPDCEAVLAKSQADWTYYLKTIRPLLGWTIFVGLRR